MTVGLAMHIQDAIATLRQKMVVHNVKVDHKALKKDRQHRVTIELLVSPFTEKPYTTNLQKGPEGV